MITLGPQHFIGHNKSQGQPVRHYASTWTREVINWRRIQGSAVPVRLEKWILKSGVLAENVGRRKEGLGGTCPEGCVEKVALTNGEAERKLECVVTGARCGKR